MKILLFGGSGQLGFEIEKRARDLNFEIVSPVISELDISDRDQVKFLAKQTQPGIIINCAAYTAVDKAEQEPKEAFKINSDGAANVAMAAKAAGCRMIHISTDYVFDGAGETPLKEEDKTNPLSVYGASKLEGEQKVLEIARDLALVVRTSSLHGQRGINFVHTMIDLFSTREVVKVVSDQYMSPTWAGWLAEVLLDLGRTKCDGVLHASCAGGISWHEFAKEILELIRPGVENAQRVQLEKISASEFGRPAKRPAYSVFDCSKLSGVLGRKPLPWQEGLKAHLRDIGRL